MNNLGFIIKDSKQNVQSDLKLSKEGLHPCHDNTIEDDRSFFTKTFDTVGEKLQTFTPINQIHQHVCGLHYYANATDRIVKAHHFCTHASEDMHQCIIYDSDKSNARIIGVEYIITKKLFETLPDEEKKFWHSHVYEVKSGTLFMPFNKAVSKVISEKAEHKEMEHLVNTYGKTWHFWQVDKGDELPLGEPQLMMAFTKDGQIPEQILKDYQESNGIDLSEKRKQREDIQFEEPNELADSYPIN